MYKLIFLGSPDFAIPTLEALFKDQRFEIVAVFSQPDKKVGRKQILTPSDVKKRALELGLKVYTPKNINTPENIKIIQGLKPDFLFTAAYGQIISNKILAIPKIEPLNLHGSLLPKYRGASPIQSSLLNGEKETGVTFIRMIEKMDAGAMFYQEKIKIDREDNAATLFDKIAELGRKTTPDVLAKIATKKLEEVSQNEAEVSYCKKISKANGKIDWQEETAEEIFNKIRAYTPWPGCYTRFEGKMLKIIRASFCSTSLLLGETERGITNTKIKTKAEEDFSPNHSLLKRGKEQAPLLGKEGLGEVMQLANNNIQITTKSGSLIPKIVQLEGKKAMSIEDFIKGKAEFVGSRLK